MINNTAPRNIERKTSGEYSTSVRKETRPAARVQRNNPEVVEFQKYIEKPKHKPNNSKEVKRNKDGDTFEVKKPQISEEEKKLRREQARKRRKFEAIKNRFIGAATALTLAVGAPAAVGSVQEHFSQPEANYDTMGHSYSEVSEWTGVDERAIVLANPSKDGEEKDTIVLPVEYTKLDEEIKSLEEKLEGSKLKEKERAEAEEKLQELKDKKAEQDAIATVYTDKEGKYAYIVPNEYVSAETLKDAFGIEDGVLRAHNDLYFSWETDDPEYGYYRDYTGAGIPKEGVVVPLDELGQAE